MFESGIAIENFVKPAFDLFRPDAQGQNGFAPFLAFMMIIVAILVGARDYYLTIRSGKNGLLQLANVMVTVKNQRDFLEKFNEIDSIASNREVLKHSWEEFKETLIPPDERIEVYRNTVRPAVYFNVSEVEHKLKLKRIHFWSGLFVGIGLLFTFIGLVAALTFAGEGIKSGQLEGAVKDLLIAASLKFWTSVSGLGCSIALKVFYEAHHSAVKKMLDQINTGLERGLQFITPEYLGVEHLREAREQSGAMRRFSTDIGVSLATALKPVNESLQDIGQRITGGIGDAIKDAAGSEMSQLANNLGGIVQSLNASRSEMDGMASTIRTAITEAADSLRAASGQASTNISKQLQETLTLLADESRKQAQAFDESMKKLSGVVDQAGETAGSKIVDAANGFASGISGVSDGVKDAATIMAERMNHLSTVMQSIEDRVAKHVQSMDALTSRAQDTERSMESTSVMLREATAPIAQASDRMASTAEQLSQSIRSASQVISESHHGLMQLTTKMQETQQVLQSAWQAYDKRFGEVDVSLSNAVQGIVENVKNNIKDMKEFVTEIDQKLGQAVQAFGSNISDLNETAEEFEQASANLLKSVDKMTGGKTA